MTKGDLELMRRHLDEADTNMAKFLGGNKSAGVRVRKSMQDIKTIAQRVRVEVQEEANLMKGSKPS